MLILSAKNMERGPPSPSGLSTIIHAPIFVFKAHKPEHDHNASTGHFYNCLDVSEKSASSNAKSTHTISFIRR